MKRIVLSLLICLGTIPAQAAVIQFNLMGSAGPGLLAANEAGSVTGGSGGEIGTGIVFNESTSNLTIHVGWGSANGFIDLTSNVTDQHVHGPTANNYGNGFTQTASVAIQLTRTSNSPSSGTISNVAILTAAQITNLFNGKYYINVHTVNNGPGEIRGFMVAVPELSLTISNGQASLLVSSVPNQKQVVEASTNLLNWSPVVTNTTGTNRFQFDDASPSQAGQRFYRAFVLP